MHVSESNRIRNEIANEKKGNCARNTRRIKHLQTHSRSHRHPRDPKTTAPRTNTDDGDNETDCEPNANCQPTRLIASRKPERHQTLSMGAIFYL